MLNSTAGPFSAAPSMRRIAVHRYPTIATLTSHSSSAFIFSFPSAPIRRSLAVKSDYRSSPSCNTASVASSRVTFRNVSGPVAFVCSSTGTALWPMRPSTASPTLRQPLLSLVPYPRGFITSVAAAAADTGPAAMSAQKAAPSAAAGDTAVGPVPESSYADASLLTAAAASLTVAPIPTVSAAAAVAAPTSMQPRAALPDSKAVAKAEAEAAYAASGGALRTKRPPGMVKRSIAMHCGYVGTAFKGLQVNRAGAPDSTVEEVLERAVFGAGLIAESNFGDLKKIKWTRNSRTDKGVHSVASVVGLRVLLPGDERFDTDPEGLDIASELNARLPPQIRVFCAQRVQKKFNARRFCFDRTYEYLLPAYLLLGPRGDEGATAGAVGGAGGGAVAGAGGGAGGGAGRSAVAAEAAAIGAGEAVEAEALRAALAVLREALSCYVGTHPFHNYTAKRKTYVDTAKDREARKAAREAAAAAVATAAAAAAVGVNTDDEGGAADAADPDEEERMAAAAAEAAAAEVAAAGAASDGDDDGAAGPGGDSGGGGDPRGRARLTRGSRAAKDDDDEPLEEDDEEGAESLREEGDEVEPGASPFPWVQSCRWLYEKSEDKRDRVTVRHFRTITSFTADDPAPLVPGGVPCVRLRVRGMSFMLHQIRHMIGGALAVARGSLPLPLLRASLAGHSRVTVPRAPPHTLILADCTFPPFRKAGADEARVYRWSGERLTLREGGQSNLAEFRRQSLDPALNELLSHPDWDRFERCLPRFHWDLQAQEEVIRAHVAWEAQRAERAKQRQEEAAAAAAAAAATAAAEAAAEAAQVPTGANEAGAPAASAVVGCAGAEVPASASAGASAAGASS